eukprot:2308654-Rhodomonas_salina.1
MVATYDYLMAVASSSCSRKRCGTSRHGSLPLAAESLNGQCRNTSRYHATSMTSSTVRWMSQMRNLPCPSTTATSPLRRTNSYARRVSEELFS